MNKRVILAGGGHAHLSVLADWIRRPLTGADCYLVTPERLTPYSGMLPGWIAGDYGARDMFIDLAPLAHCAGAKLVLTSVCRLDADREVLSMSNGEELSFDLLSLATGGETDVSCLAAQGPPLLPVRPVTQFMERWTAFTQEAEAAQSISLAIVGGGAAGVELAMAAAPALQQLCPGAHINLVSTEDGFLAGHSPAVRRMARAALIKRGVTIHHAQAAGEEGGLLLSSGEHLAADLVIAATGSTAPAWLAQSGLTCTESGFVSVGSTLRSLSHESIFAAGDIIERADRQLERSGVHAVKAGPVLAANLRASLHGEALRPYDARRRTLYLLAAGNRRAILSWGKIATQGRMAWLLKDSIDRGFVRRYAQMGDRM